MGLILRYPESGQVNAGEPFTTGSALYPGLRKWHMFPEMIVMDSSMENNKIRFFINGQTPSIFWLVDSLFAPLNKK